MRIFLIIFIFVCSIAEAYPNEASVSFVNSSTTALDNGEVFTGTGEFNKFPDVMVSLKTDTTGVLSMQFSNDGSNWDSQLNFNVVANFNEIHVLVKGPRYYRTVFTNDSGSNQTFLRLQTSYGEFNKLTSPVNGTIANDQDTLVTREVIQNLDLAAGKYQGITIGTKFGRNPDIDTTTDPEDIWNGGGTYTGFPTGSAETLEIFSSDASDTENGTGARTVKISGLLDGNYNEMDDVTVTLQGATAVSLGAQTYLRASRMQVITAGSGGSNAGTLTLRHTTTTANIFAQMPIGANQTTIAALTVPANKTCYIIRNRAAIAKSGGTAGSATYSIRVREPNQVFRAVRYETTTTSYPSQYELMGAIVVPEKSDIKYTIESVSSNDTEAIGVFEYLFVDN